MQQLIELFQYDFMMRAFWAGLIIAIIAPLIGSFLVVRRLSLIADTLAHVALTGVALGLLLGVNPLITTIITTVIIAYIIEELRSRNDISAESILAMILPGGLALALIIISLANGFNTSLMSYLFGSITAVTQQDIYSIVVLGAVILFLFFFYYRAFTYTSFDEESARTSGIPTRLVNHVFMILIALTVSVAMKVVGALLIGALMIIPVVTAMNWVKGFKTSIFVSMGIAAVSVVTGLIVSYYANLPAGATIVATSLFFFILSTVIRK
jgi:zinc transport system permease protein